MLTNHNPHTLDVYQPPDEEIQILYHDDALLVANKPAGLLTVPGRGVGMEDCLISRIQHYFANALIVHRLDMATSGIVLLARNPEMQTQLSKQFAARQISKRYHALVHSRLEGQGEIDLPLLTDWPNRPKQKIDWELGKPAQTHYTALHYDALQNITRVQLSPITGRSHQLRVHLLAIGHPIIGDTLYAQTAPIPLAQRLYLHASHLGFMHPLSNKEILIDCAPTF